MRVCGWIPPLFSFRLEIAPLVAWLFWNVFFSFPCIRESHILRLVESCVANSSNGRSAHCPDMAPPLVRGRTLLLLSTFLYRTLSLRLHMQLVNSGPGRGHRQNWTLSNPLDSPPGPRQTVRDKFPFHRTDKAHREAVLGDPRQGRASGQITLRRF